jgi:Putative prokaryotic signal transducing protein
MLEVLRSNDAVLLSYAQSVLRQVGIASLVADQYMSVMEGSIGALPRRLLVDSADAAAARRALIEAGLDGWLNGEGAARA